MARRTGQSRLQYGLFAAPPEEMIGEENPVRAIDAFVDSLDLQKAGFRAVEDNQMGASSYSPADLLKLYFYGYYNRVRSSRMLERECARNVELMWLIGRQTPSQHTVSTFRTLKEVDKETGAVRFNHRKALVRVFKLYNQFLDKMGLFGKKTFAIDGTKIAAQHSKKKHLSADKIARKLEKADNRIEQHMDELDEADLENDLENNEKDAYVCPAKKELKTSGTWHEKHGRQGHLQSRYKLYRFSFTVCSACPFKDKCLSKANIEQRHGRTIERSEYEQAFLDNKKRILLNRDKYKRRQAIVEHPFGTIKRSWGCYFTLLKRKDKDAGEMAIAFSCYNLRRTVSILGVKALILALKTRFLSKSAFLSHLSAPAFLSPDFQCLKFDTLKSHSVAFGIVA